MRTKYTLLTRRDYDYFKEYSLIFTPVRILCNNLIIISNYILFFFFFCSLKSKLDVWSTEEFEISRYPQKRKWKARLVHHGWFWIASLSWFYHRTLKLVKSKWSRWCYITHAAACSDYCCSWLDLLRGRCGRESLYWLISLLHLGSIVRILIDHQVTRAIRDRWVIIDIADTCSSVHSLKSIENKLRE